MKFQNKYGAFSAFAFISVLVLLSGCAWWPFGGAGKDVLSSDEALLTVNGKPVLTASDYEKQLAMACQDNPQIAMFLQMMPNAERDFVFPGMVTAKLMKAWVEKEGIDKTEEFKKQRQQLHEAMDLQLHMKHFDDAHPVVVTDADLESFYEAKKDMIPGLMLSPGGVETTYAQFDSKAKAEKFLDKAKEARKPEAFKAMAAESKVPTSSAVINQKSAFTPAVKNAVAHITKFPSVHLIKSDDNSHLVVLATGKSDVKYRDFKAPEVQQGLKKMATDERKQEQIKGVVDQLKKQLNVVENTKYFDDKENAKKAAANVDVTGQADDQEAVKDAVNG